MIYKFVLLPLFLTSNIVLADGLRGYDSQRDSACSNFRTHTITLKNDILYLKCLDQFHDDTKLSGLNKTVYTTKDILTLHREFENSSTRLTMLNLVVGFKNYLTSNKQYTKKDLSEINNVFEQIKQSYKIKSTVLDYEIKHAFSHNRQIQKEVILILADNEQDLNDKILGELNSISLLLTKVN